MPRYLVVAHETVTNPHLLAEVRRLRDEDPQAEFTLLVPATPVRHLLFRRGDGDDARARAHRLAEKARAMFHRKGVDLVDTVVGAESPLDAVDDEVKAYPGYAGFVISTLPTEQSRWLRADLPRRVGAKYNLPVYHVQAHDEWSPGDLP
jgi:hypothetical protein